MKTSEPTPPLTTKKLETIEAKTAFNRRLAGRGNLSPVEVARLRSDIAQNIRDYLPIVDEVIHGLRDFSPTQARLFTALLNKVIPDLSASFHQHEVSTRDLTKMSMAELEAIASGVEKLGDTPDIIDIQPHTTQKHPSIPEETP